MKIAIITPCYNENTTVIKFLKEIEEVLAPTQYQFEVIVVDDASQDHTGELLSHFDFENSTNLAFTNLRLRFNQGHQGAIYQGLLYASATDAEKFIVLDSDGEDDPRAIPAMLQETDIDIVNVVRGKRREKLSFRLFYYTYRAIFKFITGSKMNFGNYATVNRKVVENTVHNGFVHYAAHLSKQRASRTSVVFDRRKRIDGKSKMNLNSLIHHAFKSFIEYAEQFLMIFLKLTLMIAIAFLIVIIIVVYLKFIANQATPGWASTLSIGLFNTALISFGFFSIGILLLNIATRRPDPFNNKLYQKMNQKK